MKRSIYLLPLLFLTSCSITGRYYLRNLTDQPATVTILLNENVTPDGLKSITLRYDDKVRNINFGMYKRFKKEIKLKQLDASRVEFTVPPRSTVFIGVGINSYFRGWFDQAKINVGERELSLITSDKEQMNLKMKGLFRYTGHYDIMI